jgi:hypothetical protein
MQTNDFLDALYDRAAADRLLNPLELMQKAVYGRSYTDSPSKPLSLPIDEAFLSEELAGIYLGEKAQTHGPGYDNGEGGETTEVKFRRLNRDQTSSAYYATLPNLLDKKASKLFFLVYNPCLSKLDAFMYTESQYKSGTITVRWSQAQGCYTEAGGKYNLIELPSPEEIYEMKVLAQQKIAEAQDNHISNLVSEILKKITKEEALKLLQER